MNRARTLRYTAGDSMPPIWGIQLPAGGVTHEPKLYITHPDLTVVEKTGTWTDADAGEFIFPDFDATDLPGGTKCRAIIAFVVDGTDTYTYEHFQIDVDRGPGQ